MNTTLRLLRRILLGRPEPADWRGPTGRVDPRLVVVPESGVTSAPLPRALRGGYGEASSRPADVWGDR